MQNFSPCRICSIASPSNKPRNRLCGTTNRTAGTGWGRWIAGSSLSQPRHPKLQKGAAHRDSSSFSFNLIRISRSWLWRVKWATAPILHLRGFASILTLEYPIIAKGAKYWPLPTLGFRSQQLPHIVHLNVSYWLNLILRVHVPGRLLLILGDNPIVRLPRSQRLVLPPEACSENWNIGHEPASDFSGVLAASRNAHASRPHPSIARVRGNCA